MKRPRNEPKTQELFHENSLWASRLNGLYGVWLDDVATFIECDHAGRTGVIAHAADKLANGETAGRPVDAGGCLGDGSGRRCDQTHDIVALGREQLGRFSELSRIRVRKSFRGWA